MKNLKAYMGFCRDEADLGTCLVFAYDLRQAKRMTWDVLIDWFSIDYIDLRVRLLDQGDTEYFLKRYNPVKPKVIGSPECCKGNCDRWGNVDYPEDDGSGYYCEDCHDQLEEFGEIE